MLFFRKEKTIESIRCINLLNKIKTTFFKSGFENMIHNLSYMAKCKLRFNQKSQVSETFQQHYPLRMTLHESTSYRYTSNSSFFFFFLVCILVFKFSIFPYISYPILYNFLFDIFFFSITAPVAVTAASPEELQLNVTWEEPLAYYYQGPNITVAGSM